MQAIRVWVRPLGEVCRVRVDGVENTRWLMGRLSGAVDALGSDSLRKGADSGLCSFEVPCTPQFTASRLEEVLSAMPEVQVMTSPA